MLDQLMEKFKSVMNELPGYKDVLALPGKANALIQLCTDSVKDVMDDAIECLDGASKEMNLKPCLVLQQNRQIILAEKFKEITSQSLELPEISLNSLNPFESIEECVVGDISGCMANVMKGPMEKLVAAMRNAGKLKKLLGGAFAELTKSGTMDSEDDLEDLKPVSVMSFKKITEIITPLVNAAKEYRLAVGRFPLNMIGSFPDLEANMKILSKLAAPIIDLMLGSMGGLGGNSAGGGELDLLLGMEPILKIFKKMNIEALFGKLKNRLLSSFETSGSTSTGGKTNDPPSDILVEVMSDFKETVDAFQTLFGFSGGASTSSTNFMEMGSSTEPIPGEAPFCLNIDGRSVVEYTCRCQGNLKQESTVRDNLNHFESCSAGQYCNVRTKDKCHEKPTLTNVQTFILESINRNKNANVYCPDPAITVKFSFSENLISNPVKMPVQLSLDWDFNLVIPLKASDNDEEADKAYFAFGYGAGKQNDFMRGCFL